MITTKPVGVKVDATSTAVSPVTHTALVDMTSPAVSHHLRQLRSSGLIVSRREGKEVYYRAADTEQSRLLHRVIEETMAISCPE